MHLQARRDCTVTRSLLTPRQYLLIVHPDERRSLARARLLLAITTANLLTTHYASIGHPEASVYTALGLVAFDLVARDRLHDLWGSKRLLYLGLLIAAGSLISYAINRDAATATIAVASGVALAAAL